MLNMARRCGAVFVVLAAIVGMAGCATKPQAAVDLPPGYLGAPKPGRIGVVMSELPKPDTEFPGAWCLLCLAVANGAHSSLSKEVQGFSTAELKPLVGDLAALLNKRGMNAVAIDEPLKIKDLPDLNHGDPTNKARKDFSGLKAKYQVDRLLVVDITALGVWRSYSGYVPTDQPKAVLNGNASIVDLSSHTLEWFLPIGLSRPADGAWDEPPKFPGLSNAYYQLLESGMDMVKKPFTP